MKFERRSIHLLVIYRLLSSSNKEEIIQILKVNFKQLQSLSPSEDTHSDVKKLLIICFALNFILINISLLEKYLINDKMRICLSNGLYYVERKMSYLNYGLGNVSLE